MRACKGLRKPIRTQCSIKVLDVGKELGRNAMLLVELDRALKDLV